MTTLVKLAQEGPSFKFPFRFREKHRENVELQPKLSLQKDKASVVSWCKIQGGAVHAGMSDLRFDIFGQVGQNLFGFQVSLAAKTIEKRFELIQKYRTGIRRVREKVLIAKKK